MERHARIAFPAEACGLLEGSYEENAIAVVAIHPMANESKEQDRFEIDPLEHLRLLRESRGRGREIVGCYHSHPNGRGLPSARDFANGSDEGFVWSIIALEGKDTPVTLSSFLFGAGGFEPLEQVFS